jgi:hypothetical protein
MEAHWNQYKLDIVSLNFEKNLLVKLNKIVKIYGETFRKGSLGHSVHPITRNLILLINYEIFTSWKDSE